MTFLEPQPIFLEPDAAPIADTQGTKYWRKDAADGSHALLEALCKLKGDKVPTKVVTISSPGLPDRHITTCKHCGSPVGNNRMLIVTIQATVAAYYRINPLAMTGDSRTNAVARPRQVAMYLAEQLTGRSWSEIGRRFNRDHTTVIHAFRQIKKRIETDPELAADVGILRAMLCPEMAEA